MLRSISQEAIAYQVKDPFIDRLTAIFEDMYRDIDTRKYRDNIDLLRSGYDKKVEKLIKNRFNLTVVVDPDISFVAPLAIIPFSSDVINQMNPSTFIPTAPTKGFSVNNYSENDVKNALTKFEDILAENRVMSRKIDSKRGTINLKTATVSGYLADVRHFMILNVFFMKEDGNLTPRELAAATTHEIGHAFTGLEYHYKMVTTNNAIAEVLTELNNNNVDKALYVFKSRFGPAELEEAALNRDSTREDFSGAVVMKYMKELESQYGSNYYDATSFEYLSDNFATKMGAGSELSTGLDKLNTVFDYGYNRSRWSDLSRLFKSWLWLMGFSILAPALGGIFGVAWTIRTIFIGMFVNSNQPIYDNYRDRHTRIANEISNILKNTKLPNDEKENLIRQWELVKAVESINFNYKPYEAILMGVITPRVYKDRYYKQKQRSIENALSNSLFVSAAKMDIN